MREVTDLDSRVDSDRGVDGEVKRNHRVAAVGHREGMYIFSAFCDVSVLVPVERFARHGSGVARHSVFDGEIQRNHGIAAVGQWEGVRVFTAFCEVGKFVPIKGIALHSNGVADNIMVDGQVEGDNGVAPVDIRTGKGVREVAAAFGDVEVLVPVEGLASDGCGVAHSWLIHRDGEGTFSGGGTGNLAFSQRCGGGYYVVSALVDNGGFANGIVAPSVGDIPIVAVDGSCECGAFALTDVHVAVNRFDPTRPVSLKYVLLKKGRPFPVSETVTNSTNFSIPKTTHGLFTLTVSQRTIQGWSEPQEILSYNVARPFIMTIPAYLLIIAIILSISVTISKVGISLKQIDMDRAINAQESKHKDDKISLLSNLAHELRTPLSLIYNPVKDMIEEKTLKGADYERIERIFNQVQKMTEMVNMILDKGTNDINKNDISIESVDMNEWLGKIIEDFKIDCYAKGLKTQFNPMSDLGKVDMDVKMMETAVNNIMSNAIKYSDTGTITVTTGRSKGTVWIQFHDEGRGFTCRPEELFKRYYRENENIPGYGLGLSQAKLMIELLDGNIKAEKNDGPGSTFTIEIPDNLGEKYLNAPAKPQVPVIAETSDFGNIEEPAQTEEVNFDTKSMTLLIVDDQDDILQFIKDEYSPLFKTIYTAHDGKEALDLIRQRMPNVVVSDIMMPRMNGFELCKTIKTDLELSSIPVILLTSRSDPKNQDMGYKMGADSFLPKPFDSKLLYKIIRSQLKNRYEIKRQYATSFFTAISEDQTFSAADEQFVLKLNRFIRENLSNTMLGVDMIVEHMNVSRTTLFNKMNNLVGASTNKYIRRIRIDIAKEMLSKTNKSVGTIAEETGFSESQYFSTVFKQETGMTPSQFKDSLRKS